MTSGAIFIVYDKVMEFFADRSKWEREDWLRVFKALAESPYQKGDWRQTTNSGRELRVRRFYKWLVAFWLDDPVLEVGTVDVKKIVP